MTEAIKKWEFVPEGTINFEGRTLTRIRALVDYPNGHVKAGQFGGYIEKPENLDDWGWVSDDAKVFDNGLVYRDGLVSDEGRVYGNGRVYDNGRVFDNGQVFGNGRVFGNGQVYGDGIVFDNGRVFGHGRVYEDGWIYDNGRVIGHGQVYGDGQVYGNARVLGNAQVLGFGVIFGYMCVSGDGYIESGDDIIDFNNVGSEKGNLTAHRQKDGSINLIRGCFSGSIKEFIEKSAITHASLPKVKKQYELIIEVIKHHFDLLD